MSEQLQLDHLNPVTNLHTREEFKNFLNLETNYFIYFTATWCKFCGVAKPQVVKYLTELQNREVPFTFLLLDADDSRDIVNHLKIRGFPTTLLIKNNEVEEICVGAGEEDITHFFNTSYQKIA